MIYRVSNQSLRLPTSKYAPLYLAILAHKTRKTVLSTGWPALEEIRCAFIDITCTRMVRRLFVGGLAQLPNHQRTIMSIVATPRARTQCGPGLFWSECIGYGDASSKFHITF